MEDMEKIKIMMPEDVDWPALLRQISQPPKNLFIRGTWPPRFADGTTVNKDTKFLCVVGARRHSVYGREACQSLINGLAGYNICIVSGLALGLDAVAHEAALDAHIPTIAFPGSGLRDEVLYPPRNVRLARRILEAGGTLISEYNPDEVAAPWCFPERNRLMAGISHATLVIEAKRPSGTLITSGQARDYNRDVFAVPGEIFSPLSEGPHMLIKQGAAIIRNSDDILHELGIRLQVEDGSENTEESSSQSGLFESIDGKTEIEKMLYKIILEAGGKISVDDLIGLNNADTPGTLATISLMETNELIKEKNGMIHIVRKRF